MTVFSLSSYAVYINDEGDYDAEVDKFIPQSRVVVKNSVLADKLENAAQKQLHKNKGNEKSKIQKKEPLVHKTDANIKKTYKWF